MALRVTFLGHAALMVESEAGTRVLIDPWLNDNPGAPYRVDTVPTPDYVVLSHGAYDHSGDAVALLQRCPQATLLCPRDVRAAFKRKGVAAERIQVMVIGFVRRCQDLEIRAVQTLHGSFIDDGDGCYSDVCLGHIISDAGGASVYHMGDTAIFSDLKLIGELYAPTVAFVPVGSAPGSLSEMTPKEAAIATAWVAPQLAVPMHYTAGVQDDLVATWQRELGARAPGARTQVLAPGEVLRVQG